MGPQTRHVLAAAIGVAGLGLAASAGPNALAGVGQTTAPHTVVSVMEELARALDGLERAARAGDDRLVSGHVTALARAAAAKALVGDRSDEERRDFGHHVRALRTAVDALARGQASERLPRIDEVKRACTQCHVQFRDTARSVFPATGSTIAGVVEVRRLDGASQSDRSGVAVFLEGVPRAGREIRSTATVSQRDRRFSPRVLPIVRSDVVHFPNDDTIFHNIFSRSVVRPFDLGTYASGERRSVEFRDAGLVKVYCNIHPDMVLSVLVLANRFFDVTDDEGHFAITGIPDGTFTLRTWHERGGDTSQRVTVRGGVVQRVTLGVQETRRSIEHLDKFGQPYKRKY